MSVGIDQITLEEAFDLFYRRLFGSSSAEERTAAKTKYEEIVGRDASYAEAERLYNECFTAANRNEVTVISLIWNAIATTGDLQVLVGNDSRVPQMAMRGQVPELLFLGKAMERMPEGHTDLNGRLPVLCRRSFEQWMDLQSKAQLEAPKTDATVDDVLTAIKELVALWKAGSGRTYGRETLWNTWRSDDGLFPGLTWGVFYAAWKASSEMRPDGWGSGKPRRINNSLPDSARLIRRKA